MQLPCLYHYSIDVIEKVLQKDQYSFKESDYTFPRPPGKPYGFWVSVRDDWKRWCKEAEFRWDSLEKKHRVKLHKDSNILIINNIKDFDEFSTSYGYCHNEILHNSLKISDDILEKVAPKWKELMFGKSVTEIRWEQVKEKYQGILIYPYFHCRRLFCNHSRWYYGWDCASGCIWDTTCIREITLVK